MHIDIQSKIALTIKSTRLGPFVVGLFFVSFVTKQFDMHIYSSYRFSFGKLNVINID